MIRSIRQLVKPDFRKSPDAILHLIIGIAGVSIALILTLYGIAIHRIISGEITRDAMDSAVKASRAVFALQKDALTVVGDDGKVRLYLDQRRFPEVDRYFRNHLQNFDILKVKVYDTRHRIIYSTDAAIIGRTDSNNRRLARALGGEIDTHLVMKDRMLDLADESRFKVEVVETYIPITVGAATIGAFEIYTDVTQYRREIAQLVAVTVMILAVILVAVFACSYLLIRKATTLLKASQKELAENVVQLEEALANVKQLEGIIPICMHCKKIRDDKDSWHQLEQYISRHSEAHFSHGICPECYAAELNALMKNR